MGRVASYTSSSRLISFNSVDNLEIIITGWDLDKRFTLKDLHHFYGGAYINIKLNLECCGSGSVRICLISDFSIRPFHYKVVIKVSFSFELIFFGNQKKKMLKKIMF